MPRRHENGLSSPFRNALCSASSRKKAFAILFPKMVGEERAGLQSRQLPVPPDGMACLLMPLAPGRLKKVSDFCLAK